MEKTTMPKITMLATIIQNIFNNFLLPKKLFIFELYY